MIIQNKRIFASVLFVLISFVSIAQGSSPPPPTPPPPPGLPIDGGLLLLLLIGLLLGAFYLIKSLKSVTKA
jgi:hypothetical protein